MLSIQEIRESLQVAEQLARLSLTSGGDREDGEGDNLRANPPKPYVPPKQLLMYLV
ncbi:hypothetical protein Pcinc_041972, partial [Petrolisthes cinctipes]